MESFLDILFPKSCSICKRKGTYLCSTCRKLFKRNLPECYLCRRISQDFKTHNHCKSLFSLDHIFICWEYNPLTSDLLKKYKYSYAYDIEDTLQDFFLENFLLSNFRSVLKDTLITNVPLSSSRMRDRGFNQTYCISKGLAGKFNLTFSDELIGRKDSYGHQALRDKEERKISREDLFFVKNPSKLSRYDSITIVDDVVTTGSTLESISKVLKNYYGKNLVINAVCMFRGKPYYSADPSVSS